MATDRREDAEGVGARKPGGGGHLGQVAAQIWVQQALTFKGGAGGRQRFLGQTRQIGLPDRQRRGIGRIAGGEGEIGAGVIVARQHPGIGGQGVEAGDGGEHLLGRALEEPPAAVGHQTVGREQRFQRRVMEGNMAQRVAGGVQHLGPARQGVARREGVVQRRQAVGIGFRAPDGGAGDGDDFGHGVDVVVVVMGDVDPSQPPAAFGQPGEDRGGLGRVDQCRVAGRRVMDEVGVIVLKTADDLDGHGKLLRRPAAIAGFAKRLRWGRVQSVSAGPGVQCISTCKSCATSITAASWGVRRRRVCATGWSSVGATRGA